MYELFSDLEYIREYIRAYIDDCHVQRSKNIDDSVDVAMFNVKRTLSKLDEVFACPN